MTSDEIKQRTNGILNNPVSIQVYFVLKTHQGISVKLADIDNGKTSNDLKNMYIQTLTESILHNEQFNVIELSHTDERTNAIYHYDLEEIPDDLNPLCNFSVSNTYEIFSFAQDDLKNITGLIIFLGSRNNHLILYKKHYTIGLIRRNSFMMFKSEERFVEMEEDLVRLSSDFQFMKIDNELFIMDLKTLEKFFGFHEIITKEALLAIDVIEGINILEDADVLREATDNVSFARKLTKVRNSSPILTLNIPNEKIINYTRITPGFIGKFKYSEDGEKIRLDTKKSKEAFVKLLNDDILKSELTQLYYDSLAKDQVITG